MSTFAEVATGLLDIERNNSRQFVNLVEVLAKKGLLSISDLEYIREHDKDEGKE